MISILGIPFDEHSSYLSGCRLGPAAIRSALQCASSNSWSENEVDVGDHSEIRDAGDVAFDGGQPRQAIEVAVGQLLAGDQRVLSLGGDHAVTYPILRAYAQKFGKINLLQLDAHPDLYDEFDRDRFSHACPFARAHEDGLISRHVQLGIRTMNGDQRRQAERFGVEVLSMSDWPAAVPPPMADPLYVTLDLDILDPAFAPGISHYEPGGATVRQVLDVIQNLNVAPAGADIVELNPTRDTHDVTALVAAKFMKELLAAML